MQSVCWHPTEAWLLATGSFDKTIGLIDARNGSTTTACAIPADIESLTWDPFNPFHLYVALEDGTVMCVDVRNCANNGNKAKAVLFSFQAHEQTVSSLSFSSRIPGMLSTASIDKTVKVWDVTDLKSSGTGAPRCVAYKTMNVGKLFAMQYSPDDPFLLACAGDTGMVAVWESDEQAVIEQHFKARVTPSKNTYSALQQPGSGASSDSATSGVTGSTTGAGFGVVEMAIAEKEDESWMEDNAAPAPQSAGAKQNKKKKDKKGKL